MGDDSSEIIPREGVDLLEILAIDSPDWERLDHLEVAILGLLKYGVSPWIGTVVTVHHSTLVGGLASGSHIGFANSLPKHNK